VPDAARVPAPLPPEAQDEPRADARRRTSPPSGRARTATISARSSAGGCSRRVHAAPGDGDPDWVRRTRPSDSERRSRT
jgi:hypothetical protein